MEKRQAQRKGDARYAGWRGLSIMKDLSIYFKDLPGSPGEQRDRASAALLAVPCRQSEEYQQLHQLCFVNNRSGSSIEKALGPSKKSLKNRQSSNGSSSSSTEDWCIGKHSSEPMAFINFSDL